MTRHPFRASSTPRSATRKGLSPVSRAAFEALEERTLFSTFTVTNGGDSGAGSLRDAIALADGNPGTDTVNFAPGVTTVTLTTAQLNPITDMTIAGPTGGTVTVTRSAAAPDFRIFRTGLGSIVELDNLKITNGRAADGGAGVSAGGPLTITSCTLTGNTVTAASGRGGGVFGAAFTITSSTISGNTSGGDGGGVYSIGGTNTVNSSTISGNSAGGNGGGIYLLSGSLEATATTFSANAASRYSGGALYIATTSHTFLTSCTFTDNQADATGGVGGAIGLFKNPASASSSLFTSDSRFSGNTAAAGGAIYSLESTLGIFTSTFSHNAGQFGGGAILAIGGVTSVTDSTLSDNTTDFDGGAIGVTGTLTVTSSTLSGNSAGRDGGGIFATDSTLRVTSSTISGNSAGAFGGGILTTGSAEILSSTLSGNSAATGGGIAGEFITIMLNNTIVANSTGGDLSTTLGTTFLGGANLIEDGSGGASLGKISGDPGLAPLGNYGGPTQTHALLPGSIALDAGNDVLAIYLTTDQRGFNRFVGTVDIGAFEAQSPAEQAAGLQARVRAFQAAGVLNKGQANSLIVKLNLKGNNGDEGKVQSFLNEVQAYIRAGILTQAQGDTLLGPGNSLLLSVARR